MSGQGCRFCRAAMPDERVALGYDYCLRPACYEQGFVIPTFFSNPVEEPFDDTLVDAGLRAQNPSAMIALPDPLIPAACAFDPDIDDQERLENSRRRKTA